jgi:hypothetical protein
MVLNFRINHRSVYDDLCGHCSVASDPLWNLPSFVGYFVVQRGWHLT